MSIGYCPIQSMGKGVYRQQPFKVFATVITLDDFSNCIRDISDGSDVLCGSLGLLNTLTWSRYLPHRKSVSKGDSVLSSNNSTDTIRYTNPE